MSTYKNAFHDPVGKKYGPAVYETKVPGVEYRGFTIYQRISNDRGGFGGVADVVIGGVCIMQSVTVENAKHRVDNLISEKYYEDTASELMRTHGIPMPGELFSAP